MTANRAASIRARLKQHTDTAKQDFNLTQSGRYPNASEVLSEGLRLIEERERLENAKLEALKQAARQGWTDVSSGRYADVADDQLEDFIGQLGRRAAQRTRMPA
jgi:antitoxin ParD1/3/4